MIPHINSRISATLLAGVLMVGSTHAASVIETEAFDFTPAGSPALNFNKFDTTLGTLTNVTISWSLTKVGGSLFVDNDSAEAGSGVITQTVTISLASTGVTLSNGVSLVGQGVSATSSYTATVGADDGDGSGVQPGGIDYDGTTFTNEGPVTGNDNITSGFWSQYSGTGENFNINVSGTQGIDVSAISGVAGSFTPADATGSVTVTYTYDAVPEPSAALLGGLGILGLLIRRRR